MRFVQISDRKFKSIIHEFPVNYVGIIKKTKRTKFTWKNLTLMKDPMSLAIYQQFFQEFKPKTILEFGTYDGGSAIWMDDILKSLNITTKIYTFDVNPINIKTDTITTITWDNYNFKSYVESNIEFFNSLEHPLLVIEDSHVNVSEVLSEVDNFLIPGDYIIIEDTLNTNDYKQMLDFLNDKNYLVDTHYCDFWGLNNSWNFNSYLIKV